MCIFGSGVNISVAFAKKFICPSKAWASPNVVTPML